MDTTFVEQVAGARRRRSGVFRDDALTLSWGEGGIARILTRDLEGAETRAAHIPDGELEYVLLTYSDLEEGWIDKARKRDYRRIHCVFVSSRGKLALASDALAPLTTDIRSVSEVPAGDVVPLDVLRECVMTAIVMGAELELGVRDESSAQTGHPYRQPGDVEATPRSSAPELDELRSRLNEKDFEKVLAVVEERVRNELRLGWCDLGDEGLRLLTSVIGARKDLRRIDLASNDLTVASVPRILELASESALKSLSSSLNPIGDAGLEELLDGLDLAQLNQLAVASCELSDRGLKRLCERLETQLGILELDRNDLTAESAQHIAANRYVRRLQRLSIGGTNIGVAGLKHLVASENLHLLSHLGLDDLGLVGAEGIVPIVESPSHFGQLSSLSLARNKLLEEGGRALASARFIPRLDRLVLQRSGIGDEGALPLLEAGLAVRHLDLSYCDLTSRTVEAVFAEHGRLSTLVLSGNPIGDRGARMIAEYEEAGLLHHIYLQECGFSSAGKQLLADSPILKEVGTLRY